MCGRSLYQRVIPAKAGTQRASVRERRLCARRFVCQNALFAAPTRDDWVPAFAGMTALFLIQEEVD